MTARRSIDVTPSVDAFDARATTIADALRDDRRAVVGRATVVRAAVCVGAMVNIVYADGASLCDDRHGCAHVKKWFGC